MNEELKQKIEALYRELLEMPLQVVEVFNDFYGEERVDLQPISLDDFIERLNDNSMNDIVEGSLSSFANSSYMRGHRSNALIEEYSKDVHTWYS